MRQGLGSVWEVVDDALDAIDQLRRSKVQNQTQGVSRDIEVGLGLASMSIDDLDDGFHFYGDAVLDGEIQHVRARDNEIVVTKRQRNLAPEVQLPALELQREARTVGGLQAPDAYSAMNGDRRANDLARDPIELSLSPHAMAECERRAT